MRNVLLVIMLTITAGLFAAPFQNLPYTLTQPDGSQIQCLVSGDEFFNYAHDFDGYTIIVGDGGYYYYAVRDGQGDVKASPYRVGTIDPAAAGLQKHAVISKENYLARRTELLPNDREGGRPPPSGTVNNIVVYVRFADQTEFTITRAEYDAKFNSVEPPSMYSYFQEVSYQTLAITSHHYPECEMTTNLSYQDSHPRGYYSPHSDNNPDGYTSNTQMNNRKITLLVNAINYIAGEVPASLDIDADNDNKVDNVSFIIRGSSDSWADLLWAHRGWLSSTTVYINNKRVYDYTFEPENQNDVKTICHEMFHSIGAPDLYHYTEDGNTPVGPWDLMENGSGHMLTYMKYRYADWITTIPEISTHGTYTLNPTTVPSDNCYKIPSPNSDSEYFVVEYRTGETSYYDNTLPGDGLIISRINTDCNGDGNTYGPPDEVYVYRQGGTPDSDGSVTAANFAENTSRTSFNDTSDPYDFLSDGSLGGIHIHQVGVPGETISFILYPGTGILEGSVSSDNSGADLTQADILINGTHYNPGSNGSYSLADWEGHYTMTCSLQGHGTVAEQVELIPDQISTVDFNLHYLDRPYSLESHHTGAHVTLNWGFDGTDDENFVQFNVWRKIGNFAWSCCGNSSIPSYEADLNQNLQYKFYILAEYTNGVSDSSNWVQIDWSSTDDNPTLSLTDTMIGNYPNPFNPNTTLRYQIARTANVEMTIYNLRGQVVRRFEEGIRNPGLYNLNWNGTDDLGSPVASGVYYTVLKVGGKNLDAHKMILMK